MAVCGSCGSLESEVDTQKGGYCGKCGADVWIEWIDFTLDKQRTQYVMKQAKHLGLSYPELVIKVLNQDPLRERGRRTNNRAIIEVFTKFVF